MEVKTKSYYLLLGSNLNDPYEQLRMAYLKLSQQVGFIKKSSNIYQTAAWGMFDQNDFLNQLIILESQLSPHQVLSCINSIELEMGRQRTVKWGERIIDIDILYVDDLVIEADQLIIPHPEIQNRGFALIPLNELAPQFIHPTLHKTNRELLAACVDTLPVHCYMLNAST